MGLLGAISFSLTLVSLIQIPFSKADCPITSAVSAGPSAILVKWEPYEKASNYILDLRVTNNTDVAPVLAVVDALQKTVQGLRPGTNYTVTLKVLKFFDVVCSSKIQSCTVPDTPQITSGVALSSTAISLKWTDVPSAQRFYLVIYSQRTGAKLNLTYSTHEAVVRDLQPSTNYDCFVYSANNAGVGYASKVRTVTTLVQPPDGIKAVQSGRNEADLTWLPVQDVLMYRVSVQGTRNLAAAPLVYNVTGTSKHLTNIMPCSEYLINISSYNMFLVPSEPSVYSYTTNSDSNPVSSVTVDYSCSTDSVTVQWMPVQGADSYKAKAVTDDGTPLSCTGSLTSCKISGLSCGKSYEVHVTPISANCENQVNSTYATFQSVPCPPQNLSLLRSCDSEVILFSWGLSSNAQVYKAKSIDSKGVVQECYTEDNSCYFTQTHCGRHYYFSVYSMSGSCNSATSNTVDISTAPCIPQNVKTLADCNSNALVSKWDLAEGALNYTVEAFGNRENGNYTCSSFSNSCSFEDMKCGESLTIYITSHDEYCSSPRTLAPVAETAKTVSKTVAKTVDNTVAKTVAKTLAKTVDNTVAKTVTKTVAMTVAKTLAKTVAK
ncbi:hypothetical protein WMY93_018351 [Mugilogobius chulae]|uniref:Fibronectin type-III domain-containing protein n=1 Tax=Mugilogobius chulae TaxID=88201 RepID=A0AAW0NUK0_9GOBI